MNLMTTLFMGGHFDDALTEGQAILDSHPDEYRMLYVVGAILLGKGDREAAITHFSRALQLAPDFKRAQHGLEQAQDR